MRSVLTLLAALGLAACLAAAADQRPAEGPKPRAVARDGQDLVFFHGSRPYRFRLHLQVKGRPFLADWGAVIGHLFRYLDADGDGVLSQAELARAPSPRQWLQLLEGATELEPDAAPDLAAVAGAPAAGPVTPARLESYYRRSAAGPLRVEWGWRQGGDDALTVALFQHLDRDRDGKLARAELEAAFPALHKLDANGDEMVTPGELLGGGYAPPEFLFHKAADHEPVPHPFPVLVLHPDHPVDLPKRLLDRYDRDGNGKLSRAEFGLDPAAFGRLDADRDGELDAAELARWRDLPPDLEVVVPLDAPGRLDMTVVPAGPADPPAVAARRARHGGLVLSFRDQQVELLCAEGQAVRKARRKSLLAGFGKGPLTGKDIYQPPFTRVGLFRLADRDGDGKLSRQEYAAYLDLVDNVQATITFLTVVDRGRTLFELLDADHDGRLSQRELRSAWARVAPWARAGALRRGHIPQQFQLTLSHGARLPDQAPSIAGARPQRGPLWFRKMDRNGDGDVSRTEFLGTAEQFRRIDTDGDGLIDAQEAERADRSFRRQRP
jgi:Ca2+-binding EF-hand superfamily protein